MSFRVGDTSAAVSTGVERDTDDIEDVENLFAFVAPPLDIQSTASSLGIHFNRRLFNGWVKQPSPCCAASSVAGAWNALFGLHRRDLEALHHPQVLSLYVDVVSQKLEKKVASFERKLGASFTNAFWEEFTEKALRLGKEWAGKKGMSITKATTEKILKEMAIARYQCRSQELKQESKSAEADFLSRTAEDCLVDLFLDEGTCLSPSPPNGDESKETEAESDDEELDEEDEPVSAKGSSKWVWRADFGEIVRHRGGLSKLQADRASTAFIGNWGILMAFEELCVQRDLGSSAVSARLFMGKRKTTKSKVDVPLLKKDSPQTVDSQWDALRSALANPRQVLLLHWSNHYALVFALREWIESDGSRVRQLLTARRGQRPTVWATFDEIREAMLAWDGYKMIVVERRA